MEICLSQELIDRYVAGDCVADEQQAVEIHLSRCESCRHRIDAKKSSMSNSGQSNTADDRTEMFGTASQKNRESQNQTMDFRDETLAFQDESPAESIPHTPTIPSGKGDFTQSLDSMIEGYKILEELPRGGQAAVYKAVHIATKTNVAIKVLLPTMLASARARYYFEREAELIASLDHPNIVAIRDSGIIHQQYYFIMQFIVGQPLDRYIMSEGLSFRQRILLFKKICSAITYAHQQGIIHRDLKFANILVDTRGEPHILDFGLAKAVGMSEKDSEGAVATMTGQLAGTLSTMSPEQAAGRPDLIDMRTDVYSLGVILYRMLTGEYPYDVTSSTLEVLKNIQQVDPVRPRQMNRKFDSDVEAILLTALEKEPDKRYHSAADLQSDIDNWLNGRPIRVKSISTMYLVRKIIARHRYASTVAALLLLIVLAFAYISFDSYLQAKRAHGEAEASLSTLSKQLALNNTLNRFLVLDYFLDAWKKDSALQMSLVRAFMSTDSREYKAASFLSDPSPIVDKEDDFRRVLSNEQDWFIEFIIGEGYLKDGKQIEAYEAFNKSLEATGEIDMEKIVNDPSFRGDALLIGQITDRLEELKANFEATEEKN